MGLIRELHFSNLGEECREMPNSRLNPKSRELSNSQRLSQELLNSRRETLQFERSQLYDHLGQDCPAERSQKRIFRAVKIFFISLLTFCD